MLVDAATSDDAAVYQLDASRALVATADFFTPIVDDAYDFGRIAAANALSDVYAMGASPLFALNLVGFPRDRLGDGLLEEILRGGGEVARQAGIAIVGGHSIDDAEPKYGLCAIGLVDPGRMLRNSTARAGDVLVLTKPLGTGVIATAIKRGAADEEVIAGAVRSMTTLNRVASEAAVAAGAHAVTDVTGYGLIGHLGEMTFHSGVAARLRASAVPLLDGAAALAEAGFVPGGTQRNRADNDARVSWQEEITETQRVLLCDAQTSGGLLIAVPAARLDTLLEALGGSADGGAVIGAVVEGAAGAITVEV